MAGHSKFKNIMHRKGAQDKKRSAMFSKLSREITVAAKLGMPDPDMNPRLRAAVNAAKAGDEDKVLEAAIEAGADDVESDEEGHAIWTAVDTLHPVARELEKALGEADAVKLAWKPSLTTEVDEDAAGSLLKLIDWLDEDDDVQAVWGNYDIPDAVMEKLS